MFAATVVLFLLLTVAMGASAGRKAAGAASSGQLRDRLAVPATLWSVIGGLEACAVLGLLLGLAVAPLGVAAAAGVAALMAGAVAAHLRRGIGGAALTAPAVLFALAVAATVARAASA